MSKKILFWKNWSPVYTNLLFINLAVLLALLIYTVVKWWYGADNIIDWNIISTLNQSESLVNSTTNGGIKLAVVEPLFYITEKYVPTGTIVHVLPAYLYLIGLVLGVSMILAATSRLKSFWFMSSIAVLGAILLGFDLEIVFNQLNKWPFLIAFFLIGGIAYYFNSWANSKNLIPSLSFILIAFILMAGSVQFFAKVSYPFVSIANHSLSVALLVSAIFIFFIAHEIIAGILNVTSSATVGGKNSVGQFLIAAVIFIINALQIYLENANRIEDSTIIIDPIWLLVISFVLGIWGFRQYCLQTELFSFQQSGFWLYAGGGFITFSTISYIYATDNNPLIELTADFISITHLVVSIAFTVHVVINFMQPMKLGLAVHRVLYKPPFSRLVLARLVAVFAIFFLFSLKGYYSVNQYMAGRFNSLGDYSLLTNDLFLAETYYKKSASLDALNHKANYSLASLAQSQDDVLTAGFYFKQAITKNPTPYAYVGLSESLTQADMFFDANFILKEGIAHFAGNNFIATNLGRQFAKSSIFDSTYLYADIAYQHCGECNVEAANLLAFWVENAKINRLDSIVDKFGDNSYAAVKASLAAIRKKQQKPLIVNKLSAGADSILNVSDFALLYNYVTNPTNKDALSDENLLKMQEIPENSGYFSDLFFIRAKRNYQYGDKSAAIQQLSYLTRDETKDTKMYDLTLGGWFLNEGIYDKALDNFYKGGDTTSVENLQLAQFKQKIDNINQKVANQLLIKPLTLSTYPQVLQKAPFNPYIVEKVVEIFEKGGKQTEAYKTVFDAVQVNRESVLLWKIYVTQAAKSGLRDYARDGLTELRRLLSPEEFERFNADYQLLINKSDGFDNTNTENFPKSGF